MNPTKQDEPVSNNYGDVEYWQKRYEKSRGERFDWLQSFQTCFELIEKYLNYNKDAQILNIGCGNAKIQDDLYEAGYQNIINNDISKICIEDMQKVKQQKGYTKMVYQVMDVREMTYQDQLFDMVLDKSTIDALMCSDEPLISVCKMVEEVYRVLKPNGTYLIISYASPTFRLESLKRQHTNFDVKVSELTRKTEEGQQLVHYLYVCKKLPMKSLSKEQRVQFYHRMKQLQDKQYPPISNH